MGFMPDYMLSCQPMETINRSQNFVVYATKFGMHDFAGLCRAWPMDGWSNTRLYLSASFVFVIDSSFDRLSPL